MTVSIALRQSSVIDVQKSLFFLQNDQNYKGASKKPSSVTGLSDRTVRCKIKLVIWRYAVSEVLNKFKEEKFNLTENCALSPF